MKKNKLLYILTILITLFTFNMNVKALDLTCLYENKQEDLTIALIQEKEGTTYKHYAVEIEKYHASISDEGWKKVARGFNEKFYNYPPESSAIYEKGKYPSCPGSMDREDGQYVVYNESDKGKFKIMEDSSGNSVVYYDSKVIKYEEFSISGNASNINGAPCNTLKADEKWLQTSNELDSEKYQMACLYQKNMGNSCHVIQINVGKNQRDFIDSKQFVTPNYGISVKENVFTIDMIKEKYQGQCPKVILVAVDNGISYIDQTKSIDLLKNKYNAYSLIANFGNNIITDKPLPTTEISLTPASSIKICDDLFGDDESLLKLVKFIINLVKIFIPISLIGFGIADFGMAVFSGEEDKMKKAQKKFTTRIIVAVIIFLVPSLLKTILTIANSVWPNIDATLCNLI